MIKDRLVYYNQLPGLKGERLATLFRFQSKPSSDHPRIYLPCDSLLNHKSRLVRNTHRWLSDLLSPSGIEETQFILICHDVPELIHGDTSRLSVEAEGSKTLGLADLLLPEDLIRVHDFEKAQAFLERGSEELPKSPYSIIARILDTIDGNYFAFALLETYACKVGGEITDQNFQEILDRSFAYVNKMRLKYRTRIALAQGKYGIDLMPTLDRLHQIEAEKIGRFAETIKDQGYRISKLV